MAPTEEGLAAYLAMILVVAGAILALATTVALFIVYLRSRDDAERRAKESWREIKPEEQRSAEKAAKNRVRADLTRKFFRLSRASALRSTDGGYSWAKGRNCLAI